MPLKTKEEYLDSLRNLKKRIFMFGDEIEDYVDHPMIRPSIHAIAST